MDKRKYILITLLIGLIVFLSVGLGIFLGSTPKPFEEGKANVPVRRSSVGVSLQQAAGVTVEYSAIEENISQINKKIDKLDLSITKLGQSLELIKNQRAEKLRETVAPPIRLENDQRSTDWLSGLDSSTRVRVDDIFKQNALRMRKELENFGSIENIDRKAMQETFESNQESLKNELQKVLSAEDYQKFLNNSPQIPPDLTALPKK